MNLFKSEYNSIECREAIKQSFSSLQNMQECKNSQIDFGNLNQKKEDDKIESFQFFKRKLKIGQWVDVKDTIDQWLEAQVIDIKDNRVYIHYNGWGTRWDEWIDMDSDRIMPFRYYTKQTTISNYNTPFPNVKPDANVNVYNQNDLNQQHQFYDFFNDLDNCLNQCKKFYEKINENREFIRKNRKTNIINNYNNINLTSDLSAAYIENNEKSKRNNIIEDTMDISNENKPQQINVNNNNLIIIPEIEEEQKTNEINNIDLNNEIDKEKINKIKQREIFFYSKQLSPFLDRLGRIMTDMGLYMYHNINNNKLEE